MGGRKYSYPLESYKFKINPIILAILALNILVTVFLVTSGNFLITTNFSNNNSFWYSNWDEISFLKIILKTWIIEIAFLLTWLILYFVFRSNTDNSNSKFIDKIDANQLHLPTNKMSNSLSFLPYYALMFWWFSVVFLPLNSIFSLILMLSSCVISFNILRIRSNHLHHNLMAFVMVYLPFLIGQVIITFENNPEAIYILYTPIVGVGIIHYLWELHSEIKCWYEHIDDSSKLDYSDVKLISMMVRDQDWQARVELQGLSSEKICSSIKKFEDFIENREYQKGKWIAQLFDSRINSDLSTSDIIDVLLRNTRNRTIGYYGKYIIAVIFPVIFLFIVFAVWCERQGSTYQLMEPGPQNIAELDNLLEKGARYFDIKTNDGGEVLSISTKYSSLGFEKHIIPADGSSHFTKGGSFFEHYFTLNESYKRISRLAKEGIWFNKGGVADEIIVRSGFTTRYNAFLRFKRIEYLNEDSLNLDTINFQESTSGIFPQFAKSSVTAMISCEFEDWLK